MDWDDVKAIGFLMGAVFLLVGLIGTLIIGVAVVMERKTCLATGSAMGGPHRWGFWTDCMIEVDGRWVPLSAYKVVRPAD